MNEFMKELNDLLSKHGITMDEAIIIYEKKTKKIKKIDSML